MEQLMEYLPFLIPVLIIEIALMLTALIHILRHHNYRIGNRPLWIILVLLFWLLGPIIYFVFGKGDE